jgi:uncharacterized protein YndB with AHSA1/START domain
MRGGFECVVACPPEAVFDFLADLRNETRWNPGAVRIERLAAATIGRGNRFRGLYKYVGWVETELVEFDRPRRLSLRGDGRWFHLEASFVLQADGAATAVAHTRVLTPHGRARLVTPLLASQYRAADRRLPAALARLRG